VDHESVRPEELGQRAAAILRGNDAGSWTKAAPNLYPHQWSWDSAFVSIGWAHLDIERAADELRSLFRAQWKTGKIPHIVFNPAVPDGTYFPGPGFWACSSLSDDVPSGTESSGLLQPPVHAIAAWRIWEVAHEQDNDAVNRARAFLQEAYPYLLAWHRYLITSRDPEASGLIATVHPWEGLDNSPRWDSALARIEVGNLEPYERADLKHVKDASQRPTMEEYDRYLWLVELMKQANYDDAAVYADHPYLVRDVFMTGILVAANIALQQIGEIIGAQDADRQTIQDWIDLGIRGLVSGWDEETGLALDFDVRANEQIRTQTIAGFAPLVSGRAGQKQLARQLEVFDSTAFCGHPELRWPLPPSTSPNDPAFDPRRYWRGPNWPFLNWFFWWALKNAGQNERAAKLRSDALNQISAAGFAEYIEPFTGEGLGSSDQSWTASMTLDWLAADTPTEQES
jgi:glucosylglycerate hydrolase